jgi:hypothetical protein
MHPGTYQIFVEQEDPNKTLFHGHISKDQTQYATATFHINWADSN